MIVIALLIAVILATAVLTVADIHQTVQRMNRRSASELRDPISGVYAFRDGYNDARSHFPRRSVFRTLSQMQLYDQGYDHGGTERRGAS